MFDERFGDADYRAALLELFPLKLVGGFITVDQHVGCVGCRFCLSRRHPLWLRAFAHRYHADEGFETSEEVAGLLGAMRPFTEARVPVRFGHNTDSRFQWDFGASLYRQLPRHNPFIFMTRFPVPGRHHDLFQGQPNLLLKMTITPPSRSLGVQTDVAAILRSIRRLPPGNIYFLVGPLARDNLDGAREIMDALPVGSWADAKSLTRDGIPGMGSVTVPTPAELEDLRERGRRRSITTTDFFGCLLRRGLGRPFYKIDAADGYLARTCQLCHQQPSCTASRPPEEIEAAVRGAAREIDLQLLAATHLGPHTTRFDCVQPASRGDETYLSELLDHRVLLSSVPEGSEGGSFCLLDPHVLRRWERTGMFPTTHVAERAARILDALHRSIGSGG